MFVSIVGLACNANDSLGLVVHAKLDVCNGSPKPSLMFGLSSTVSLYFVFGKKSAASSIMYEVGYLLLV